MEDLLLQNFTHFRTQISLPTADLKQKHVQYCKIARKRKCQACGREDYLKNKLLHKQTNPQSIFNTPKEYALIYQPSK